MKNIIIIVMTLMPILALGQNKAFGSSYLPTENELDQHLVSNVSNDPERNIETTLIDDRRYDKSALSFDLDKSYNLSFTAKKTGILRSINNQKSDEKLLEIEPLLDLKWQFRNSSEKEKSFEK